jgi:two-component system sensor kinase FixL
VSDQDGVALRNERRGRHADAAGGPDVPWPTAIVVGLVYFIGAKIGFELVSEVGPLSLLWPPNALLLGMLLLLPARQWWLALSGALPAHMLAQLLEGVPLPMALAWFASNVSEALIGAWLLDRAGRATHLDSGRAVLAFLAATTTAVVLSSFADAGLVRLIGWKEADFWAMWQSRLPSNILAILIFVPVCLALREALRARQEAPRMTHVVEVVIFEFVLLAVSLVVFDSHRLNPPATTWPGLVYLPLPFLIWAALRFRPLVASLSFSVVAFVVIWGVKHGRGPFVDAAALGDAQPTQWFLISLAVPMMLLAGVVAERRAADRRLRATESLSAAAFGSSADAIAFVRREDGHVVEANERWSQLFPQPMQQLSELLRSGRDVSGLEVTLAHATDGPRRVQVSVKAVGSARDDWALCTVHDVTALRRAEQEQREQRQQLIHLNRVAVLAGFAGSLAHELNQPLTAILSNAQAATRFLDRAPLNIAELRAALADIVDADKRAGELIHHLRLMMKKDAGHFERLDPNALVERVLDLAHGELARRGVEFTRSLSRDLPPLHGDRVQLQQLLLNLVSNACDALAAQGGAHRVLSIATVASRSGGTHILVDDNGTGIAPDRREAVFQPFVTSKPNGLGLGLSICRLIAETHGGSLAVEDHEGGGTRMRLVLPAAPGG